MGLMRGGAAGEPAGNQCDGNEQKRSADQNGRTVEVHAGVTGGKESGNAQRTEQTEG